MHHRLASTLALGVLLAGCAGNTTPPPDTARLPGGAYGTNVDGDVGAIQQAQWALAAPGRTRGRPVEAARALAGVDYLAGELTTSPRWAEMGPLTKQEMLQARAEIRTTLGVPQNAPSQAVVDGLLGAGNALANGQQQAASEYLRPPVFSRGPEATLALLTDLPFQPTANVATTHAAGQLFPSQSGGFRSF
jgi:hypothetical protein